MSGIIEDAAQTIANDAASYYALGDDEDTAFDNAVANNQNILAAATAAEKAAIWNRANEIWQNMPKSRYHLPGANEPSPSTRSSGGGIAQFMENMTFGFTPDRMRPKDVLKHPAGLEPAAPTDWGKVLLIGGGITVGAILLFAILKR